MSAGFGTEIARLLAACDEAQNSTDKGNALQDLAEFLFGAVDGFEVLPGKRFNVFGSEEIDLPCFQNHNISGMHFVDAFFLIECKNRADAIPAPEVEWFISKLERRDQRFGILLALNGISGNPGNGHGPTYAHHIVAGALKDGIRLIVITRTDIEALTEPPDLVQLIKRKLGDLLIAYEI